MPTYVYECSSCSDVFEVEQRITEDALKDCHCGSKGTIKRVIQPVGISFKGSGFYVNDSGSSTPPPAKKEKVEDTPIPEPKAPASKESTVTSE
jgi:putative FmdB family regulatory protein